MPEQDGRILLSAPRATESDIEAVTLAMRTGWLAPAGPDLAGFDQASHGTDGVLQRHVGVDPVQVIEVDDVEAEPFQAGVDRAPGVRRAGVAAAGEVEELIARQNPPGPLGERYEEVEFAGGEVDDQPVGRLEPAPPEIEVRTTIASTPIASMLSAVSSSVSPLDALEPVAPR